MTENTGIFNSLQKYFENVSVLSSVMILIAIFTCLFIVSIFWLALRKSRLWYWNVNIQLETLKRIDDRLAMLESKIAEANYLLESDTNLEIESKPKEENNLNSIEMNQPKINDRIENVSKTGRIYTVEELEILIQE